MQSEIIDIAWLDVSIATLFIVAAGFVGVLLAQKLSPNKNLAAHEQSKPGPGKYLNVIIRYSFHGNH